MQRCTMDIKELCDGETYRIGERDSPQKVIQEAVITTSDNGGLLMRMIVVDDEQLILDNMMKQLRRIEPQAELVGFVRSAEACEYLSQNKADVAFLDIEMGKLSGIALAKKCKDICPAMNIVFVTGYSQYAMDAFRLHVSGYLMKPVRENDLRKEIENLRYPIQPDRARRVRVKTFGGFDIFTDETVISFGRAKAKEVLAYLVNKRGLSCTSKEIATVLWEDEAYDFAKQRYFQTIIANLMTTLKGAGAEEIIIRKHNSIAVDTTKFECDLYNFQNGDINAVNAYAGEYMSSYSWAEFTVGYLDQIKPEK